MRELLGDFDDRAVLILDGCSSHLNGQFRQVLEEHRVTMRFLVSHTSHLTKPLDIEIFGRLKSIIRSNASYTINLANIDRAVADENAAENERREPSTEPGKKLADFIIAILQAFHQATTPRVWFRPSSRPASAPVSSKKAISTSALPSSTLQEPAS